MRQPVDGLRSLKRYVALALGSGYEVRLSGEKGVFARPYARVVQVPGIQFVSESWHTSRIVASFQVVAFPQRMASADEAQVEAMRVADLLWTAFAGPGVGVMPAPVDDRRGHPARVPLYDYSGVPLRGAEAFVNENARSPRDFMKLEAPVDVNPVVMPEDDLLWSVAANIRMSWLRSAAVPSTANTTVSVGVSEDERNG